MGRAPVSSGFYSHLAAQFVSHSPTSSSQNDDSVQAASAFQASASLTPEPQPPVWTLSGCCSLLRSGLPGGEQFGTVLKAAAVVSSLEFFGFSHK